MFPWQSYNGYAVVVPEEFVVKIASIPRAPTKFRVALPCLSNSAHTFQAFDILLGSVIVGASEKCRAGLAAEAFADAEASRVKPSSKLAPTEGYETNEMSCSFNVISLPN